MKRGLQKLLLTAYRGAAALGLPSTKLGYRAYEAFYLSYKWAIESGSVQRLRDYIEPRSTIVDVGANIGFFTLPFAKWVGADGRVVAVEPEARNFGRLRERLRHAGTLDRVELMRGVVAERSGRYHLSLNPNHPGDHRLSGRGEPVEGWSLDDLLAMRPGPPVCFVKIDVQGAELRVLKGASKLIAQHQPVFLIEVEPPVIREVGGSTIELLEFIAGLDYEAYIWTRKGAGRRLDVEDLQARASTAGHLDVLYLPRGRVPA